jgi:hypothetical protein
MRMRRGTIPWLLVALAAAVLASGCGGSNPPSVEDYTATVVDARDRVDFALARLTRAHSLAELLNRMDEASVAIDAAADDLDAHPAAKGLDDENAKLVRALHGLANDVSSTADQFRDPAFSQGVSNGLGGLSFETWTTTNKILDDLRSQGIAVEPLARH